MSQINVTILVVIDEMHWTIYTYVTKSIRSVTTDKTLQHLNIRGVYILVYIK